MTDIHLYLKDVCREIALLTGNLFRCLQQKSESYKDIFMPGYTHERPAMPSTFGLWLGAYAEVLVDDMHQLGAAWEQCDQNPLGSAAGYGNSFPLDRRKQQGFGIQHLEIQQYCSTDEPGKNRAFPFLCHGFILPEP